MDEIISCDGGTVDAGGGNTDRQDGQKDLVSQSKVLEDLNSETGILLSVLAAVVSKAIRTKGLEQSRHALDKVKRSSGLF